MAEEPALTRARSMVNAFPRNRWMEEEGGKMRK